MSTLTADSAAVLLLDLPQAALAGIDLLSFTTTPRFHGVKDLPKGLHFIFTGTSAAFSLRHGIWFRTDQLTIAKWSPNNETLALETNQTEQLRWRANVGTDWEHGLTPYRQSDKSADDVPAEGDWPQLTSYVSDALLSRITGDGHLNSASSAIKDLDDIPGLAATDERPEKELRFLPIDLKRSWREGATGRERTDAAQDRSWLLGDIVSKYCSSRDAMELVGELQLCFIMVLTLNNWSCLEQWKRILSLLFTCREAVQGKPDLFIRAIATLRLQLGHCKDAEGGLFDLADEGGSLLKGLLVKFRKGLEGVGTVEVQDVIDELDDLEAYLRDEHGWQFGGSFVKSGTLDLEDGEQVRMDTTVYDEDEEEGEFAPQIVDLTPEQAKMLGVEDSADLMATLKKTSLKDDDGDGITQKPSQSATREVESSSEDEEETEDLEDMDSRY